MMVTTNANLNFNLDNNASVGIVAEYNPLHNGHKYMMDAVKSKLPGAACVVVLGSNFTQRGTPAIVDKWTRTQMALAYGADLVIELPFLFSCAAAPDFSAGAVDLLARTHLATHIAFGMEDTTRDLTPLLDILLHEPLSFKQSLKKEMSRGASYPKAMAIALGQALAARACNTVTSDTGSFLSSPNDLLALSYMMRVRSRGYALTPLPIARVGLGHNERDFAACDCVHDKNFFASAGAIRESLDQNFDQALTCDGVLSRVMPNFSRELLLAAHAEGRLCLQDKADSRLWVLLQGLFLRSMPDDLRAIDGMDEGLENLFLKHWRDAQSLGDFIGRCVSARNTAGRIRRRIMRLLLGVKRDAARATIQNGIPWARVLGFNTRGRALLRASTKISELPIITRLADTARNRLSDESATTFTAQLEFKASALYEMLLERPQMHREERMTPVILPQK